MVILGKLSRIDPVDDFFLSGLLGVLIRHLTEAGNIPQLITKISSLFDTFLGEADILALRSNAHNSVAQSIRTVFFNKIKRVRRVTQGFGHFSPLGITDNASEINIPERNTLFNLVVRQSGFGIDWISFKFQPCHNHASNPEEDDIRTGDQSRGRIEKFKTLFLH